MNLREPLAIPADRPLDVLIHARYSTDEQSQSSIDGQINSCQRFLTANLPRECRPEQVNVEIIREPEISGEIADRPGINQVWAGMRDHRWDVILAEESSRLYRHMTFASQFFDTAVDAGIRVICPTDYIDQASPGKPLALRRGDGAARHRLQAAAIDSGNGWPAVERAVLRLYRRRVQGDHRGDLRAHCQRRAPLGGR